MTQKKIVGAAALVFIVGAVVIVWQGRPVMKLAQNQVPVVSVPVPVPTPTPTPTPVPTPVPPKPSEPAPGTYTLATIATHNTKADCWAAVNGGVYDLTTWVSRHPGGSGAILRLCGTDGSAAFNRQHGRSGAAQSALVLLKIGTLAP